MSVAERTRQGPAVQGEIVVSVGGLDLGGVKAREWTALGPDERALVTREALARWTEGLAEDDWEIADVVRLERRRRIALQTLRDSADLTDQEWRLARFLMKYEARVCSYTRIAKHLWGRAGVTDQTIQQLRQLGYASPMVSHIQNMMSRIRKALEIDPLRPQHFANVRGAGYVYYSQPPAKDDGIDYDRRLDEHHRERVRVSQELGLVEEGEYSTFLPTDRDGMTYQTRLRPGPDFPDHTTVREPILPLPSSDTERSPDANPDPDPGRP